MMMRGWLAGVFALVVSVCGCAPVNLSEVPAERATLDIASDGGAVQDAEAGDTADALPITADRPDSAPSNDDVAHADAMDVTGDEPGDAVDASDVTDAGMIFPLDLVVPPDQGMPDAGFLDTGAPDISAPDTSVDVPTDRGTDVPLDVGSPPVDIGFDAGPPDVGAPDTGPVDTGPPPCPSGQTRCSTGCVDTRTSVTNCNGCGITCATPTNATPACTASACGIASCNAGFGNCDGNAANGCETNTQTNRLHCGACGNVCASGVCSAGVCLLQPALVVAFVNSSVVGIWVRTGTLVSPNPTGSWFYMPCDMSSATRTCLIDLRRLDTPGALPGDRIPVSSWSNLLGLDIIPVTSMTTPLCPIGAATCPGCGTGTSFSCLRVTCASTGVLAQGQPRYEQLYNNVLPLGMSGSGTLYAYRIDYIYGGDHVVVCPDAPGS